MPQNVPEFPFSAHALALRQFVYEHWCRHGHGPNLRAVHEHTGLSREQILEAYQQLDLGIMCIVDQETQNCNLLKAPPFSSYPSQAAVFIDDRFHCYAGCAMESLALCMMPPFAGKEVRIESYCACCLEPVSAVTKDGETLSYEPADLRIHVSSSPRNWNKGNIVSMCDSMNYVLSPEHGERHERTIGRRGVLFTMVQARKFITGTGKARMWQYDRGPDYIRPQRIIDGIRALGVDVSGWGE
jgi:hypothetical protein